VDRIGNYRIDCERSRSTTVVVYEGRHLVLPRRALLKVMEHKDAIAAVQLLREACILEALEHPGVVRVYESGLLGDRRPWFAHERVDGATVADLLSLGPLDPPHASALLRDVVQVLEHAHRRGVIHCGLHAERIAITGRTRGFPLCVLDWSHARTHDTTAPLPTKPFSDYAAPELVRGDAIDDRADVFALGVIGHQALTGELPRAAHARTGQKSPDAPLALSALIDQMLAHDRFNRPSSAEVYIALAALAAELPGHAGRGPVDLRIRKPRWTPSLPVGEGLPDLVADDVTDEKSD